MADRVWVYVSDDDGDTEEWAEIVDGVPTGNMRTVSRKGVGLPSLYQIPASSIEQAKTAGPPKEK